MFKKLNLYLLTHYPTLWNLRWPIVIGISIFVHFIFFTVGFLSINAPMLAKETDLKELMGNGPILMSVLFTFLIEIIWLIYVLKNNAFKSFYAIDKWYGVKSFFLMLTVLFISGTFYESYFYGIRKKITYITTETQYIKEQNTINKAMAFLPINVEDYFIGNKISLINYSADTYDYYNIADNENRKELYVRREIRKTGDTSLQNAYEKSKNEEVESDYITKIDYYIDTIYPNFRKLKWLSNAFAFDNYGKKLIEDLDKNTINNRSFVIYEGQNNYIEKNFYDFKVNESIENIIRNKAEPELKELLSEYLQICKKYKIANNINIDSVIKNVFSNIIINVDKKSKLKPLTYTTEAAKNDLKPFYDPRFFRTNLSKEEENGSNSDKYLNQDFDRHSKLQPNYIDEQMLKNAYKTVNNALRYNKDFDLNTFELFFLALFFSICFTVLLFMFRRTSGRVFLFSIIGSVGWMIITGLFTTFVSFVVYKNNNNNNNDITNNIMFVYFSLVVSFCLAMFLFLKNKNSKIWSGIWLSWFSFLIPFTGPAILAFLSSKCQKYFVAGKEVIITPFYCYIENNIGFLLFIWVIILLIIAPFILSKLTKMWNIMADE